MDNSSIKAIVFDLGRVLVDFDHWISAKRLKDFCDSSEEEIYQLFFDSELTCLFEEGKISPLEFFDEVKKILKLKIDYPQFLPIWNEIFFFNPQNQAVYNLAKKLKSNYPVCLASNINVLHFEYLKNKFSIFDIFDKIFLSYEIKARKPSLLMYRTILESLSLSPQEVFYTDDRPPLVESAQKLGIKSFVFLGVDKLKKDLLSLKVRLDD